MNKIFTYEFTIKGIGKGKTLQEALKDYLDTVNLEEVTLGNIENYEIVYVEEVEDE